MKVSAKWKIVPTDLGVAIKVRGDGPDNLDFPETTATINGNEMTISNVECENPFVDEVDFVDPMSIAWSVSADGGATWYDAGMSANPTYIALGDPQTELYQTLIHLGCKNAKGETSENDVVDDIWAEFTDLDVRRVDGTQLAYYASSNCQNITTAELLSQGDGQCGAWAQLLNDTLKCQSITNAAIRIV